MISAYMRRDKLDSSKDKEETTLFKLKETYGLAKWAGGMPLQMPCCGISNRQRNFEELLTRARGNDGESNSLKPTWPISDDARMVDDGFTQMVEKSVSFKSGLQTSKMLHWLGGASAL